MGGGESAGAESGQKESILFHRIGEVRLGSRGTCGCVRGGFRNENGFSEWAGGQRQDNWSVRGSAWMPAGPFECLTGCGFEAQQELFDLCAEHALSPVIDGRGGFASLFFILEEELKADPVFSSADNFPIESERAPGGWILLVSHGDAHDGAGIPPLFGVDKDSGGADVAHGVRHRATTCKEIGNQAGKRLPFGLPRIGGFGIEEALQPAS